MKTRPQSHDSSGEETVASDSVSPATTDEIFSNLYGELKRLAVHGLGGERSEPTPQATALVNEAYLRLGVPGSDFVWENKRQFISTASEAMRRILVDHARAKQSLKRGGDGDHAQLDDSKLALDVPVEEVLAVDEALEKLKEEDPIGTELVTLRYFVGLTMEEIANALEISEPTAHRNWASARNWLYREIQGQREGT